MTICTGGGLLRCTSLDSLIAGCRGRRWQALIAQLCSVLFPELQTARKATWNKRLADLFCTKRCKPKKGLDSREPELTLGGPSVRASVVRKCLLEAKLASVEMLLLLHTKGDDWDAGEETCSGAADVGARACCELRRG